MRKNDLIYDPSIGKRGGYLVTLYGYDRTGVACEHLGCAREDLDDVIKEDSDAG